MTSRTLLVAATLCAALIAHGPAEAAKNKRTPTGVVNFEGCAIWVAQQTPTPRLCLKVGNADVTGSGILPLTYVSGSGKTQATIGCPALKDVKFKTLRSCFWPWLR